jgi:hypothetical protein
MAEREGHILKEDDPVTILARNVSPAFACRVCGKFATQVASGGYYDMEDEVYCNECARKKRVDTLPIVNSPRVGVCGYTGMLNGVLRKNGGVRASGARKKKKKMRIDRF